MTLRIGTRASDLALFQTRLFQSKLNSQAESEIIKIVTRGDKDQRAFLNIAGDGFFTKELEHQLLEDKIDFAVHSCKDLASQQHIDLSWQAFDTRESVYDILIINADSILSENPLTLKPNLTIGTSSPRRTAQAELLFPGCKIEHLRGNVPTRIQKAIDKKYDAIILAEAGVSRLNLEEKILGAGLKKFRLPFVTAPGQGILSIQIPNIQKNTLQKISNAQLTEIAHLEKEILALLGGGCHLACGARIEYIENEYVLHFFLKDETDTYNFTIKNKKSADLLRDFFSKVSKKSKQNTPSKRMILTQPVQNQLSTARDLSEKNYKCIPWILTQVRPCWNLKKVQELLASPFDCVVFTSQFGARIFFQDLVYMQQDLALNIKEKPIFCIGERTAAFVEKTGLKTVLSPEATASSLSEVLESYKNPLLIGTSHSILGKELTQKGKNYNILEVYQSIPSETTLRDLPHLESNDTLVLTSPSIANEFLKFYLADKDAFKNINIIAFGPSTSRTLEKHHVPHKINPKPGSWEFA